MLNPSCLKGTDFINKFIEDYTKLEGLGFTRNQALRMLGSLKYVNDYCDTPYFIDFQKKLPKGYKWSDGKEFYYKSTYKKVSVGETYVFLIIEDDLYIRGIKIPFDIGYNVIDRYGKDFKQNEEYKKDFMKEYNKARNWATVIKDFRSLTSNYVTTELYEHITPFLHNCIMTFWKENGLSCGSLEPVLKNIDWRNKNE